MGDVQPAVAPGVLVGVDEAGLGPILGPLVVGGVSMAGPRGTDPWQLLAEHVARAGSSKHKVLVADSKKVHQGPNALPRLERTVLAFVAVWLGEIPATVGDLLAAVGCDTTPLSRCPWYADLALPLPHANDRDELELFAHLLGRRMRAASITLCGLAIRPVDVEEFNASIDDTDNKSDTHFRAYSEVIGRMLEGLPGDGHLVADRCGGRVHYAATLRRRLPGWQVRMLGESAGLSTYELRRRDRRVRISFAERGEDRAFPTALASCAAKYLRELLMVQINEWFAARVPGLRPTAGYYVDGHRFLRDVAAVVAAAGFPLDRLVRCR